MNKTKIDWTTKSWNPIQGCSRACHDPQTRKIWCYAYNRWQRFHRDKVGRQRPGWAKNFFVPKFFEDRLDEPARIKKPTTIFVCSMGDLFDPNVPWYHIRDIFYAMRLAPQHTYIILTKQIQNAEAYARHGEFTPPPKCIIGVSLTGEESDHYVNEQLDYLVYLHIPFPSLKLCVSAEPLRARHTALLSRINQLDWLIIGAQTGANPVKPEPEWIGELVEAAQAAGVPTWVKENAEPYCRPEHFVQQRPSFEE